MSHSWKRDFLNPFRTKHLPFVDAFLLSILFLRSADVTVSRISLPSFSDDDEDLCMCAYLGFSSRKLSNGHQSPLVLTLNEWLGEFHDPRARAKKVEGGFLVFRVVVAADRRSMTVILASNTVRLVS